MKTRRAAAGKNLREEDRPSPPMLTKKSPVEVSPRIRELWGTFHKLGGDGDFWISSRMLVDGDPAVARIFCILRYHLPSRRKPCYQLMYRTSGANTHKKGTWFPCNGLFSDYASGELFYPKLNETRFSKQMTERTELLDELLALRLEDLATKTRLLNELTRFGTPELMHASCRMGDGLWKDVRIVAILQQHFPELRLEVNDRPMDVSGAVPTDSMTLNGYAGYALSVNYYKEDQYATPSEPWIDLRQWLHEPQTIGADSPLARAMARFKTTTIDDCRHTLYYEDPTTHIRYLLGIFLHMNLLTTNCDQFLAMKKKNSDRLIAYLEKMAAESSP